MVENIKEKETDNFKWTIHCTIHYGKFKLIEIKSGKTKNLWNIYPQISSKYEIDRKPADDLGIGILTVYANINGNEHQEQKAFDGIHQMRQAIKQTQCRLNSKRFKQGKDTAKEKDKIPEIINIRKLKVDPAKERYIEEKEIFAQAKSIEELQWLKNGIPFPKDKWIRRFNSIISKNGEKNK